MNLSNGNHVKASNNAPRTSGAARTMSREDLRRGGRENGREQSHPFLFAVGFLVACRVVVVATRRRSIGFGLRPMSEWYHRTLLADLKTPKNKGFRFGKQWIRLA